MKKILLVVQILSLLIWSVSATMAATISGRVTVSDSEGVPISNIAVHVYRGMFNEDFVIGTSTNSMGYYTINVDPGTYYINTWSEPPSYYPSYISWDGGVGSTDWNDASPVTVSESVPAEHIDFGLEYGGIITGTVFESDGTTPITGFVAVDVYAGDPCGQHNGVTGVLTNSADGTYAINAVPAGTYFLITSAWETNYVDEFWNINGSSMNCSEAQTVTVATGATNFGHDFQLEEGGYISGKVTDMGINSIQGLMVGAYSEKCGGIWDGSTSTDENGDYRIGPLPPGEYFILACTSCNDLTYVQVWWDSGNGTFDCNYALPVIVAANQTTNISDFQLIPGATVSGTVEDENGSPLTSVSVDVSVIQGDPCGNHQYVMGRYSNPDGSFSLNGIPEGTYFLRTYPADSNYISEWWTGSESSIDCNDAVEFTLTEGGTSTGFEFQLEEGGTISGHVADDLGTPIENVHVYATDADTGNWVGGTNTDASGSFHLMGLPSVDCRVHFCPSCSNLPYVDEFYNDTYNHNAAAVISLTAGSDIILENIRLVVANTIGGIISGLYPNQNFYISASDDGGTQDQQDDVSFGKGYTADASGNLAYSLNVLPGHLYRIEIYPNDDPRVFYRESHPAGTYSWALASYIDPAANPNTIDVQITHGVQLSGSINGLEDGQRVWVNAHCENGTPEDGSDDFGFGVEIWGSGTGTDLFNIAVPTGYTYQVCFSQDNGLTACYDGSDDGTFGGINPNVVVNGDTMLDPLTVTPAVTINGTVDNLDPDQFVWIHARSDADTPDGADDFTISRDFIADSSGILNYSLPVPINYSYIVEFQPDGMPSAFYLEGDINGANDWGLATKFLAAADVNGVNLTIPATGSISGNLYSDGQPVEGISVHVFADMCGNNGWVNHLGSAHTDANGDYQIDWLPVTDVYVLACPECDNRNYFGRWYDGDIGIEDCNQALPVSVFDGGVTFDIDFDLPKGPRYLNWWEAAVYHGSLGVGFDLLPGFDPFLESAVVDGPNGFNFVFDLQTDVLEWLNECSYLVSWWHDFSGPINYGEYTLTLTFKNGTTKSYTHELLQVDVTAVDSTSMTHTVNDDGSIDFYWTNPPNPNQRYQVRIYQAGERLYRSGMLDTQSLDVSADSLKCLVLGGEYTWEMRAYDNHDPYYTCEKSNSLPLTYDPSNLQNRAKWFSATNYLGAGISPDDELCLYFDVRPGSRDYIASATVTGPSGFTPYDIDLTNDWYDISTETRKNSGWSRFLPVTVLDGVYTLTVTFNGNAASYTEVDTYDLSASPLSAVDAATMDHEIYENGAMRFYWNLPTGVTGQRYNIRIRSADGSQEFVQSATHTDATQMYLSPWDLRALIHGQTFQWFVHTIDSSGGSWIRSDSITFVYDSFKMFQPADIDKDWDVDGSDLAEIVRMIQEGDIGDVGAAVTEFASRYGQLQ